MNRSKSRLRKTDRVYLKPHVEVTGRIDRIDPELPEAPYVVVWDDGMPEGWFSGDDLVRIERSKSRLRKTQCDKCGAILYGSTAALKKAVYSLPYRGSLQCSCGGFFEVVHAEDRELVNERSEQ